MGYLLGWWYLGVTEAAAVRARVCKEIKRPRGVGEDGKGAPGAVKGANEAAQRGKWREFPSPGVVEGAEEEIQNSMGMWVVFGKGLRIGERKGGETPKNLPEPNEGGRRCQRYSRVEPTQAEPSQDDCRGIRRAILMMAGPDTKDSGGVHISNSVRAGIIRGRHWQWRPFRQ